MAVMSHPALGSHHSGRCFSSLQERKQHVMELILLQPDVLNLMCVASAATSGGV